MELAALVDLNNGQSYAQPLCADDGAIPFWLNTPKGNIFAWYHPAKLDNLDNPLLARPGIVLCNTFGSEAMLLHPAYRQLAIDFAASGYPTIRFDYPGTGDSDGSPRDAQLLSAWLESIHCVVEWLKVNAVVEQVGLWGALLGATLATQVAADRSDISHLMLWAPYLSGKTFLRATKLQANVMTSNPAKKQPDNWSEGDSEAFGFLISREFAVDLEGLDTKTLTQCSAKYACLFVKDTPINEKKLATHLIDLGVQITLNEQALCNFSDTLASLGIPNEIIQNGIAWLNAHPLNNMHRLQPPKVFLQLPIINIKNEQPSYTERAIFLGECPALFGILNSPINHSTPSDIGIVLVNGGNNHRVGINRNHTEWARGWAKQGFTVLRFDIRGLGDSPALAGEARNRLYLDSTEDDLHAAYEYLKSIAQLKRVIVIGLCAGAYQGLHYAFKNPNLGGVVLINPVRFQKPELGEDGINLDSSIQQLMSITPVRCYAHFFLNAHNWRQLYIWRRKTLSLVRACIKKNIENLMFWKAFLQNFGPRPQKLKTLNPLADRLYALTQQKTQVLLLCSTEESTLPLLKVALSCKHKKLKASGYFEFCEMENTDHILSPLWSQKEVFNVISRYLQHLK